VLWQLCALCASAVRDIVSARGMGAIARVVAGVVRPWRCGLRD
jgi:hypothetical protein